ncbi:MAG: Peptidase M14, carboxypeptidase A [candidate division CPR2 bacterium GW2011_GWC1_41_48]|uniref:Peptidase M14, carboxypeptidase A n=1 Tax=candidate division CPR2 bacterium GW2011_GWC1_41_48 TaxID=1618344 RepID=A0A0G0WBP5_UNCC2|nr:MAG: Peptidase M14, carboxypeptidase A [candidate division CPR2 bacterium GW2011_GWC2_39_35]KKR29000.1 MAG: Peptidase M14, carboxypeptidase A [candidate division CPR2 bacterium GW2011_GWD2_39_7]KKS09497.1 MAG: Peptidase M14, carboxypeptidase A [candidate division CPR2 bacterium GW2011_GWC1_41_48]OGB70400.1 MAG: hypothetical protein A2Y26_00285 [candidate division CPR2 bacterium GWD2_39_7]
MRSKNKTKKPFKLIIIILVCVLAFYASKLLHAKKKIQKEEISEAGKIVIAPISTPTPIPIPSTSIVEEEATPKENVFRKVAFGYSIKGKPIEGYEIGSGDDCLFMFGSIHGNEMGTTDLLNKLVAEIRAKPNLVGEKMKLIVLPIANPDGYYDRTDKLNANLVNLNLNFATTDWQQYGGEGTFAGEKPFSEPESRVIKEIVEKYKPRRMISYHAKGGIVNPEYNHESSLALSLWYAEMTGYKYYGDGDWDFSGTATRWFKETTGNAALTVELSELLASDWEINRDALLELIS